LARLLIVLLLIACGYTSRAQHIQYRDKKKPVANTGGGGGSQNVPVPDNSVKVTPPDTTAKPVVVVPKKDTVAAPVAIVKDTSNGFTKTRAAFTMNPRPKKPYVEEQNMCDLMSRPEVAPTLPLVINNVSPEMVQMLKARYNGRLYSITGLNMMDPRLKYKLKICDRNQGKFRSEYLDKDGNVVTDPDFDDY
jgi:hypothetical protein